MAGEGSDNENDDGDILYPIDYFQNVSEAKLNSGDYVIVAPGVLEVSLDNRSGTETTIFRHISVFHDLTRRATDENDDVTIVEGPEGMEQILTILLAAHHFNNRAVTDLVPALVTNNDNYDNYKDCNVRITLEIWDTNQNPSFAASQLLLDVLPRYDVRSINTTIVRRQRRNVTNVDDELRKYPTAIIGAASSSVSKAMATIGGVWNLMQVSSISAADELDYKDQYPFFGRTIPPVSALSISLVEYYVHHLNATHIFVIYVRDSIGTSIFKSFQRRASNAGLILKSISISTTSSSTNNADLIQALDRLGESGYRYVVAAIYQKDYKTMLPEALKRGLAGDEMFWMYADTFSFPSSLAPNDPLVKATQGSAVLGLPTDELVRGNRSFIEEWQRYIATPETQAYLNRLLPTRITESPSYEYKIPPLPTGSSLFTYDAFMALALSSCDAAQVEGDAFSTTGYHNAFLNQSFLGATGNVQFDAVTGSRLEDTTEFVISNLLGDVHRSSGRVSFLKPSPVFTYRQSDNNSSGDATWIALDSNTKFIYSDNTTIPPTNLPPVNESVQFLDLWPTLFGCIVSILITGSAVGFCIWMQRNIKSGPVIASQPFFMRMVAGGVILMAMCLIPQGVVPYVNNPDAACMSGPWLLFTGFCVTFAAIFSKLRRINKIESFSNRMMRVTITPMQVLLPFAVLLTLNLSILITWTVVAPLTYEKVAVGGQDAYNREYSFTLACQADPGRPSFVFYACLGILDVIAVMICWWECYKGRNTKVAYHENKHIIAALVICSQAFLLGVPLVVISVDPSVRYICLTVAVMFCSAGILFPIMAPKIYQVREWKAEKIAKEARKEERKRRADAYFARVQGDSTDDSLVPLPSPPRYGENSTTGSSQPSFPLGPTVVYKPNAMQE